MIQTLHTSAPRDPRAIDPTSLSRLIAAGLVSIERMMSTPRGGRPTSGKLVQAAEEYNSMIDPPPGTLDSLAVKHGLNRSSLINTCSRLKRQKRERNISAGSI